jgi:ATP/maltotriose-dependent transcriptional regulator MalT
MKNIIWIDCLSRPLQGLGCELQSGMLRVSDRTIETHLQNIKNKLTVLKTNY